MVEMSCQTELLLEGLENEYKALKQKHLENQAKIIKLEQKPTIFEISTQTDHQQDSDNEEEEQITSSTAPCHDCKILETQVEVLTSQKIEQMLHLNEKLEECKNLQEQLDDLYQDYDILQSNATMDFKDNSEYWGSLAETDNEAVKVKKNKKMIRLRKKLRDRGGIEI
jgi:vancomycin resistance protein YoaR